MHLAGPTREKVPKIEGVTVWKTHNAVTLCLHTCTVKSKVFKTTFNFRKLQRILEQKHKQLSAFEKQTKSCGLGLQINMKLRVFHQ